MSLTLTAVSSERKAIASQTTLFCISRVPSGVKISFAFFSMPATIKPVSPRIDFSTAVFSSSMSENLKLFLATTRLNFMFAVSIILIVLNL